MFLLRRSCHGILDDFEKAPDRAVIGTRERLDCFGAHTQHVAVDDEEEKRDVEDLLPLQWRVLSAAEAKVALATFAPWECSPSLVHRIFGLVTVGTIAVEKAVLEEEIEHCLTPTKGVVGEVHAKHVEKN